jgi:hypothetical protein
MAVTVGTYGATDATGWTVVTASEPSGEGSGFSGAGTRKVYVDSAAANDSGAGSQASPKKTLLAATALLRNGKPDHLYLKKGAVWTEEVFTSLMARSGISSTEPILISSYGSGARPLLKVSNSVDVPIRIQSADSNGNYIAVIGIEFYSYKTDPDSPDYSALAIPSPAIVGLNGNPWMLVEDCKFSFFSLAGGWNAVGAVNAGTIIYRRNVIHHNYDTDGSHSQGMYCNAINNLIIEENVLDHNGWNETVGTAPDIFKHNLYLDVNGSIPVTLRGNILARACANGMQQRPGGTCYDNLFLNNPVAGFVANTASTMTYNVVLQGTDIQSSPVSVRGWGLQINTAADNSTCRHNIVAHQESSSPGAFAYSIASGVIGASITDNIAYGWQAGASTIQDLGTGSTVSNNAIDAAGYLDPNRSVSTYNASLGGTASLAAFLTECRLQSKDNWRPAYTANAVNNYIRVGFNMPAIFGLNTPAAATTGGGTYLSLEELAAIRRYWEELEEGQKLSRRKRDEIQDKLSRTIEAAYDKALGIEPQAAKAIAAVVPKAALLPSPEIGQSRKSASPTIDWGWVSKDLDAVDRVLRVIGKQIDRLDDKAKLSAAQKIKLDRLRRDEENIQLLMLAL